MSRMRSFPVRLFALFLSASAGLCSAAYAQASENVGDPVPAAPARVTPSHRATDTPHALAAVLLDEFTGKFVTNASGGSGGAPISQLHSGLSLFGFGHQTSAPNRVSDDFTVPATGWVIDRITFYAYQTNSGTTSTINDIRLEIRDAMPPGGSVVFGDQTTNRLTSTAWTGVYRVSSTDPTNVQRPVMEVVVDLTPDLALTAGTYWMVWNMGGTGASGPWAPPQTITGQTTTGNALQEISTNPGVYNPAVDTATSTQQGLPFIIEGVLLPVELQSFEIE